MPKGGAFPRYYILVDRLPVAVDLLTWARWFEGNLETRRIGDTKIGKTRVSTVFLGLDHNYWGGDPLLFETMVFGGPLDSEMSRCATYAEAERQHAEAVATVRIAHAKLKSIADKAGAT
jgi:hypothetical protein